MGFGLMMFNSLLFWCLLFFGFENFASLFNDNR